MAYEHFALIYDQLMSEAPYGKWVNWIKQTAEKYHCPGRKVLELGCGTGEISLLLTKEGYDVTGLDLSEDMLSIAQEKIIRNDCCIQLYQQDMRDFCLSDKFDMVIVCCDSLNYLKNMDEVKSTFKNVFDHLNDEGLFLFDVHSLHKINNIFQNQQFSLAEEEISYIWGCYPGEEPHSVFHELTFFQRKPSGLYERFDETHYERSFSVDEYSQALKDSGFDILDITADFTHRKPQPDSERIFFSVKK
ncbi:cyclopropane fatty-acyl-phospholipid synthase-like methyltransferase [Scopulibacillus daqui]|uniref:Cyclopropane fatty-acyl-phospholipid synthase-like methyltransferase n=2 Tax=Scopulibacillus daqui TaxID=1469162 RepID=A0ABS2Q0K0_9BACL|nr:class I SAM-dependent methyltransferase [Scopulibacillus daqui]MBM7645824.1 cyclopropane fatty-acyl-phospholipid synthase-like methyltransferase [Scopulibacillus daqui]